MGAGLAKQFADKYPAMLRHYRDICERGLLYPGEIIIYEPQTGDMPLYVFNFPTKDHWKDPSKLEYIERGLVTLRRILRTRQAHITSISIPKLGCGLGGLDWTDVNLLIKKYLSDMDYQVIVYGEDI